MFFETAILAALILDQIFGDPRWLPHPVKTIGSVCVFLEELFRKVCRHPKTAGICTVASVVLLTAFFTLFLIKMAFFISPLLGYVVATLILYTTIAAKDLVRHSKKVYACLQSQEGLESARKAVGMIVGRDTASLDREGVSRACVETVAENMVDGVTAPLFYAILCGFLSFWGMDNIGLAACGAMTYKAINTMDSMFGYKNEKYLHFGWAAARLDDLVNLLPARLSGSLLVVVAMFLKLDWKNSARIFRRDRLVHASPNAAHPEAAVAGALRVQLGGNSYYFGKMVSKPTIGERDREIQSDDILKTNKLILAGSLLCVLILLLLRRVIMMAS